VGSNETSGGLAERLPSEAEECEDDDAGRLLVELLLVVPTIESMEKPILGFGGLTTGGELAVTVVVVVDVALMGDDRLLDFCSSIMPANWLMLLLFSPLKCIK
jgi:hypothetical protein